MEPKSCSGDGNPSRNLHPSKPLMAANFLRCLSRIQQTATNSSVGSRSRRIRRAAYASMAYSAGHRRAWSWALLRKLRCRRVRPVILPRRPRIARPQVVIEIDRAEVLRKLVPGGTGMDYCRLLEETADYIRCLATQVRLMQTVTDSISS
ncbi:hypothetical protein OPV22_029186 [Ensete ventricosum]|uniref:IBH1-like N-terminal domain-containing protein n=1 Tax=Ensete ventricosum TaxID=4639 RepID=A0AAV8Q549_ENSVE|nr:hypothetical protein OPV22_029186 [Ensete ventricosum]